METRPVFMVSVRFPIQEDQDGPICVGFGPYFDQETVDDVCAAIREKRDGFRIPDGDINDPGMEIRVTERSVTVLDHQGMREIMEGKT